MIIYLGIGTNLGKREENIREALRLLDAKVGDQMACSSIYRSKPQGFVSDNEFANIVVAYQTEYTPEEILHITQQIEQELGRTHKTVNGIYHDRIIDIDLLLAKIGTLSLDCNTPTLTIPHPRMKSRDFVLIPLQEVEHILSTKL
jgi:2-amino-4-hydroxy-6-hydroxymethyldihydropteridine diphosphokinase